MKKRVNYGGNMLTIRRADSTCDASKCRECKAVCQDRLGRFFDRDKNFEKYNNYIYPYQKK